LRSFLRVKDYEAEDCCLLEVTAVVIPELFDKLDMAVEAELGFYYCYYY